MSSYRVSRVIGVGVLIIGIITALVLAGGALGYHWRFALAELMQRIAAAPPLTVPDAAAPPTASASAAVSFPQLAPATAERAFPSAVLLGELVVVDGCLRVHTSEGGASYLIVWPPDVTLSVTREAIQVRDQVGQVVARVGDEVQLGGGELSLQSPIVQELHEPLPSGCPGPYWLASGIISG